MAPLRMNHGLCNTSTTPLAISLEAPRLIELSDCVSGVMNFPQSSLPDLDARQTWMLTGSYTYALTVAIYKLSVGIVNFVGQHQDKGPLVTNISDRFQVRTIRRWDIHFCSHLTSCCKVPSIGANISGACNCSSSHSRCIRTN